ncbi:hypothetical protein CEXT_418201 [Caerostris extrusa]|uniref:Uncharacterized protein n=1 Tax=Caerostris extrusa TaxID=172846 RepID=A0AAV4X0I2_CAEEX|nr:hypothetical protein CEXT_418201 [Caerostris extrusa]
MNPAAEESEESSSPHRFVSSFSAHWDGLSNCAPITVLNRGTTVTKSVALASCLIGVLCTPIPDVQGTSFTRFRLYLVFKI